MSNSCDHFYCFTFETRFYYVQNEHSIRFSVFIYYYEPNVCEYLTKSISTTVNHKSFVFVAYRAELFFECFCFVPISRPVQCQ